jgi:hypothetical protein
MKSIAGAGPDTPPAPVKKDIQPMDSLRVWADALPEAANSRIAAIITLIIRVSWRESMLLARAIC